MGGDRRAASSLEVAQDPSLAENRGSRVGVVEQRKTPAVSSSRVMIASAPCPTAGIMSENSRTSVASATRPSLTRPRPRENDCVPLAFAQLPDARVHVAARFRANDVGSGGAELAGAARASGADPSAARQLAQGETVLRDQDVAGVFADGDRREPEPGRELGGKVFQAVDGDVDAPVEAGPRPALS